MVFAKFIICIISWMVSIVSIIHISCQFNNPKIESTGVIISVVVSIAWLFCTLIVTNEEPPKVVWHYRFRCKECDNHVPFKEMADPCQACGGEIDSKSVVMSQTLNVWKERISPITIEEIAPYKGDAIIRGESYVG